MLQGLNWIPEEKAIYIKFWYFEKATKYWPIFHLQFDAIKGQLISKANCQAEDSPKKRTNEFVFTSMRRVFVRFLGESSARKKRFEIIWPLEAILNAQNQQVKLDNSYKSLCYFSLKIRTTNTIFLSGSNFGQIWKLHSGSPVSNRKKLL